LPNQYTKAEAEGREKPKGANHFTTGKREKHDQATIDKIRAERAAQVAEDILDDPESSRDQKLTAAKVLLPYGKSTLQSIESRQINAYDEMSDDETREMVRALITANPWLLDEFRPGVKPAEAAPAEANAVAEPQQTQRTIAKSG
jgi:hypothetical protein